MLKISSSLKILLVLSSTAMGLSAYSSSMGNSFDMPSHLAKITAEQMQERLEPVTYGGLSPRTLVRVNGQVKINVNTRTEFHIVHDAYEAKFEFGSYKDAQLAGQLKEGDFLRVIYASSGDSVMVSNVGTGAWEAEHQIEKNIEITFIRVDKNFKPVGEMFALKTKADPSEETPLFERVSGEFLSSYGGLRYDRALKDDVLVNMIDQKSGKLTIPAGSRLLIKSVTSTRIPWTFNHKYTLNMQILDCPAAFRKQKCMASISGNGGFPNQLWAHYIAPQNARVTTFLGLEVHY